MMIIINNKKKSARVQAGVDRGIKLRNLRAQSKLLKRNFYKCKASSEEEQLPGSC